VRANVPSGHQGDAGRQGLGPMPSSRDAGLKLGLAITAAPSLIPDRRPSLRRVSPVASGEGLEKGNYGGPFRGPVRPITIWY